MMDGAIDMSKRAKTVTAATKPKCGMKSKALFVCVWKLFVCERGSGPQSIVQPGNCPPKFSKTV